MVLNHRVVPLAQADHLSGPLDELRRPLQGGIRQHMIGVVQGVLSGVEHLAHYLPRGILPGDLAAGLAGLGAGWQRRPGQLQFEVVESRQSQLPAEQGHRGHRHLALGAQVGDADILSLLLMLQHVVRDLPL